MFTLGIPQRKYVYPVIMILGLLLYLMRFGFGAEPPGNANPNRDYRAASGVDAAVHAIKTAEAPIEPILTSDHAKNGIEAATEVLEHDERSLVRAADKFNDSIAKPRANAIEARVQRQEERARNMQNTWRSVAADRFGWQDSENADVRVRDSRYVEERRRLDERRSDEMNGYRENRRSIQNRMSGYNRSSDEYEKLERQLNDLDRRHAEAERRFEREFRNMDANYSITR